MIEPSEVRAVLIIPALNEEASLGITLDRVPRRLYRSILVVDNGSQDRTAEVAKAHGATVVREAERGYGAACLRALASVPDGTNAIVFMQADASENAGEASFLLAPIYEGRADLVIGSRTLGKVEKGALEFHQMLGNRLLILLVRLLFGHRYTDIGPFRAIRLESLRLLDMRDRNFGWTIEMQIKALQHGLRVLEVPVSSHPRIAGEGKVSASLKSSVKAGIKMLWTIFRLAGSR